MPKVTFLLPDGDERAVEIQSGLTVMEGARDNGLDGIAAECGGGLICATCHIQVEPEWFASVGPAQDTEATLLEMVPELTRTSRLSCQIVVSDELDGLRVRIPSEQIGTAI